MEHHFFINRNRCRLATLFLVCCMMVAHGVRGEDRVWRHTVEPGDTLIDISERYLGRRDLWPSVKEVNKVEDVYHLTPGLVLQVPENLLRKVPAAVRLDNMHGIVRWREENGEWFAAERGQFFKAGMLVETGEDSNLLLTFADASQLFLSSHSLIRFDTLSMYRGKLMVDTRIRLQRGQAYTVANPRRKSGSHFTIQTPAAQTVVRGTRFRVGVENDSTHEETLEGLVTVRGSSKRVAVPAGHGTVVSGGATPQTPVPMMKAPDTSVLLERFEKLPLRFVLPSLTRIKGWVGVIATNESLDSFLLEKSTKGPVLAFEDLPNGSYLLRLHTVDMNGVHGKEALHKFVVFARPFPPTLNYPGDSAIVRLGQPEFSWSNNVDVTQYHIQISSCDDFSCVLYDEHVEQPRWQPSSDLVPGRLFWRVASLDGNSRQGPWSTPSTFEYKVAPGPVDVGRVALEVESSRIVLNLPQPAEGLYYEAQLASTKTMESPLSIQKTDDGLLEFQRPEAGKYYLGIRLVDRSDETPGPLYIQEVEISSKTSWVLWMLVPLALILH